MIVRFNFIHQLFIIIKLFKYLFHQLFDIFLFLYSKIDNLKPFSFGKEISGFFPVPIKKMFEVLVANDFPLASLTCAISNPPKCL
jgi:hypothetical protein